MKELSVAVLGEGRWAQALVATLLANQRSQRGTIRRVMHYVPPRPTGVVAPMARRAVVRAEANDATMMAMNLGPRGGKLPRELEEAALRELTPQNRAAAHRAESDEATMMTAGDAGWPSAAPGLGRPKHVADSDDATMMGIQAPGTQKGARSAGSEDATMMGVVGPATGPLLRSGSDDATMAMRVAPMQNLANQISAKAPGVLKRAGTDDATMMGLGAAEVAGLVQKNSEALVDVASVAKADVLILCVPPSQVKTVLRGLSGALGAHQVLVHMAGGFLPAKESGGRVPSLVSELIRRDTPITQIGALAGPVQAEDLERGTAAALVCGSSSEQVTQAVRQVLANGTLRVYGSDDVIGVELSHALWGTLALTAGLCEALEIAMATRSTLLSRALFEVAQLAVELGGKGQTFAGVAGAGTGMLAAERGDSPDFALGRLLGTGMTKEDALKQIDKPCEGTHMIRDTQALATSLGLRLPVTSTLQRLLQGKAEVARLLSDLFDDSSAA